MRQGGARTYLAKVRGHRIGRKRVCGWGVAPLLAAGVEGTFPGEPEFPRTWYPADGDAADESELPVRRHWARITHGAGAR